MTRKPRRQPGRSLPSPRSKPGRRARPDPLAAPRTPVALLRTDAAWADQAAAEAETAAQAAGALMLAHRGKAKTVNSAAHHDLKLELDVRCQRLLETRLRRAFKAAAILGEEGIVGDPESEWRWVVDPIDGTVNYAHGIPHACVSIALQRRRDLGGTTGFETVSGVVFDPFCRELWTARPRGGALLNGRRIATSSTARLAESIVSIGFAKTARTMRQMTPVLGYLLPRARKIRVLGSAALSLVYVASGRLDGYLERGLRLWDIAAGGLILERAGGEFGHRLLKGGEPYAYSLRAHNGSLGGALSPVFKL